MLRKTALYRVLYRSPLIAGGERELVLFMFGVAALIASGENVVAISAAAVLVVVGLISFRLMAKADPKMFAIYRRQLEYQSYYAPRSRPARMS